MPGDDPARGRARMTRRGVLLGAGVGAGLLGAGFAGVETDVLPGRSLLHRTLGWDGEDGAVPEVQPGRLRSGSFVSQARRGIRVGWSIAEPPDPAPHLPVALVLHGRGGDHSSAFDRDYLALGWFLAAAVADGAPQFALASVDGGETYWHDRENGDHAETMLRQEFLPLLARHGLDTARIGLLGWSMGGFGSLHLASRLGPRRVGAVAAMSPALWHDYADSSAVAFDDERDFREQDLFGRRAQLDGIPVRIDCGREDPFYAADRDYVAGFAAPPSGGFQPGDHDIGYWRRMAPAELAFLGAGFAG